MKPDDTMNGEVGYGGMNDKKNKAQNVEEVARMVFTFMSGAREFAEGMNEGDEVKLLRLRTRKNEIVIVPGQCTYALDCTVKKQRSMIVEVLGSLI